MVACQERKGIQGLYAQVTQSLIMLTAQWCCQWPYSISCRRMSCIYKQDEGMGLPMQSFVRPVCCHPHSYTCMWRCSLCCFGTVLPTSSYTLENIFVKHLFEEKWSIGFKVIEGFGYHFLTMNTLLAVLLTLEQTIASHIPSFTCLPRLNWEALSVRKSSTVP